MLDDIKHSLASLVRAPRFTLSFVATMSLGLGATIAILSIAEWNLFPKLPFGEPESLVVVEQLNKERGEKVHPHPWEVVSWREHAKSFAGFATVARQTSVMVVNEEPRVVSLGLVPADYFSVVGLSPIRGRAFLATDEGDGANRVVILSHAAWTSWFGSAPDVIGRDITLVDERCQVIGVLPPSARSVDRHERADVYRPQKLAKDPNRPTGAIRTLARLRPGVTLAQAQSELEGIAVPAPSARYTRAFTGRKPVLSPVSITTAPRAVKVNIAFSVAVGLLYAVSFTSALNLLLARLIGRRKELGIRLAMGATRYQVSRLLFAECFVLSLASGAVGVILAKWIYSLLVRTGEFSIPPSLVFTNPALAATALLIGASGITIAFVTAWQAGVTDLRDTLQEGTLVLGDSPRVRFAHSLLIVMQTSLAVTLFVCTGLLLRNLARFEAIDLGITTENRVQVTTMFAANRSLPGPQRLALQAQAFDALQSLPGVEAVALKQMDSRGTEAKVAFPDRPEKAGQSVRLISISDEYRQIVALPLLAGRGFAGFRPGDPPIALINRTFAARHYETPSDALGKRISVDIGLGSTTPMQVVGIVGDSVQGDPRAKIEPAVYFPPGSLDIFLVNDAFVLKLRDGVAGNFAVEVGKAINRVSPLIGVLSVEPLAAETQFHVRAETQFLSLLKLISALSLGITVLGIYSVTAYMVARRQGELALRSVLGASPQGLFRFVIERTLKLAAIGLGAGILMAGALVTVARSFLFGIEPYDPITYLMIALLLLVTNLAACYFPARIATRVNPADILRAG